MLAELRLQQDHPDVIIRPDVDKFALFDLVDPAELICSGRRSRPSGAARNPPGAFLVKPVKPLFPALRSARKSPSHHPGIASQSI